MIPAALLWWAGLSGPVRRAIGIGSAALGLLLALLAFKVLYDREIIARHDAKATAQAAKIEARASTSATAAVISSRHEVEQSNADARAAADGSDDPLRAGLDSLRRDRAARDRAPAR